MASFYCLNVSFILLTLVGLVLCWYAFFVKTTKEVNENYEALCDINEHMSCTKVFTSRYGRGFGLVAYFTSEDSVWNQPNPIFGAVFYVSLLLMSQWHTPIIAFIQIVFCMIANVGSVYLASILLFVLHDFCVVCTSTYLVNFTLLILSWQRYQAIERAIASASDQAKKSQ